jgi:hypothetical protein
MSQKSVTLKEENFEDSFVKNGTLRYVIPFPPPPFFLLLMYAGHLSIEGCTYVVEEWSK